MGEMAVGQIFCTKCKRLKDADDFAQSKVWGVGEKRGHCRECHRRDMAKRREHDIPVFDFTPEAEFAEGYEDELHFIAFCTPKEYLDYINNVTENAGKRYENRGNKRGRKPQGLT